VRFRRGLKRRAGGVYVQGRAVSVSPFFSSSLHIIDDDRLKRTGFKLLINLHLFKIINLSLFVLA
jgi:hypothetical protein